MSSFPYSAASLWLGSGGNRKETQTFFSSGTRSSFARRNKNRIFNPSSEFWVSSSPDLRGPTTTQSSDLLLTTGEGWNNSTLSSPRLTAATPSLLRTRRFLITLCKSFKIVNKLSLFNKIFNFAFDTRHLFNVWNDITPSSLLCEL